MTTMIDEGDGACPLCAEEMDLTDQQLKPCTCGYHICVWCWHRIMDMAAKDGTQGKCPACRTPYDRERVVGANASCQITVAHRPRKGKPRVSSEARKQLARVRVVQRNLVHVTGLPANLSDESILRRREYFGRYGKVLQVSISRPRPGSSSTSSTFGAFVAYEREEEAVRCIRVVHNVVLGAAVLRACFGTTKYCHAWLRNMACSKPGCLYLHDLGSQEDSFAEDEMVHISAYTRSRVPQIASRNSQRRSGNTLPPADDLADSIGVPSKRQTVKSASNCTLIDECSASVHRMRLI